MAMADRATRFAILLAMAAFGTTLPLLSAVAQRRGARPVPDYSRFSHATTAHRRACDSCHTFPSANWKEARDESFPDVTEFPRHESCLDCHRTQFFARERPAPKICSVCHTAVTPRETSRRPFPNPVERFRSSDRARDFDSAFRVAFPHAKHLDLLGGESPAAACSSCHEVYKSANEAAGEFFTAPPRALEGFWLKRGTFQTSPEDHATCFECHSPEGGLPPAPRDCASCHVPSISRSSTDFDPGAAKLMGAGDPFIFKVWRRRASSATFPHSGGLHQEVECTSCHDIQSMDGGNGQATVRVQSCGGSGCHVTATPDEGGALTFEVARRQADPRFACSKCHLGYAGRALPPAHADIVAKARGN